jgi:hypothetical protein
LSPTAFFARFSAAAATALFVAYAFTVVSVALPLKLLDMAWQSTVVNAIINNSTLPLVGVALAHLAAYLDPSQTRFETFCKNLRSWAIYNFTKGLSNYNQNKINYERNVVQGFQKLRNAVISAPTVAELEKRLIALNGPPLSAVDSNFPLPVLRQNLLVVLQQAETNAKSRINLNPDQIWAFGKETVRSVFTSLAFAFAFSAAAKRSAWPESLLARFSKYLQSLRQFFSVNGGKIFKTYNADRKAKLQLSQNNERQRRHSAQMNRLRQQQEKEAKKRLKTNERLRSKDD